MSKYRTTALVAAALLILLHLGILLVRYGTDRASLWGDWIDTAAPLIAALICFLVSREAGPFGRRVWRLVGFSFVLTAIRSRPLHLLLRLPSCVTRTGMAE